MKRVLGETWVLPALDDHNRAFFTSGVLTLKRCRKCQHIQHPPDDVCEACCNFEFDDFHSAGRGRIETVSVVYHAVHPRLKEAVPYATVLVSVQDAPGVLIAGNVTGGDPTSVRIGDEVRVVFEEAVDPKDGQKFNIPQWERVV